MTSTQTAALALILTASGAACHRGPTTVVGVKSFTEPAAAVGRQPICFPSAETAYPGAPIEIRQTYANIVNTCSAHAQSHGSNVVPYAPGACTVTVPSWGSVPAGAMERERGSCAALFGVLQCESKTTSTALYDKHLHLTFLDGLDTRREIHKVMASFTSSVASFEPSSAEVLCSASLREFPAVVANRSYAFDQNHRPVDTDEQRPPPP